jgi:hypothetical protein
MLYVGALLPYKMIDERTSGKNGTVLPMLLEN